MCTNCTTLENTCKQRMHVQNLIIDRQTVGLRHGDELLLLLLLEEFMASIFNACIKISDKIQLIWCKFQRLKSLVWNYAWEQLSLNSIHHKLSRFIF